MYADLEFFIKKKQMDAKIITKNHLQQKQINRINIPPGFSMVTTLSFKMKKISRRLHEKGQDCMKKFRESIRNTQVR